jgi:phosphate transport system substrate-binding protein
VKHTTALAGLALFAVVGAGCNPSTSPTAGPGSTSTSTGASGGGGGGGADVKQVRSLNGGGSSFINPIMTKWAGAYNKEKGIQVDYTSSGSGNGIQQMMDKKNDFGCTDAPMSDEQLKKAADLGGEVLHIPLVMGGVVPIYNLKDVKEQLRFTGPVLADIYLGKIKKWDDPKLKELNPKANLPSDEIAVVHRSDGSGTTYIWADYLSKVSDEWKEKVGKGTDLKWPVGVGAQKSDGVAGQVGRSPGAIGYVELSYALNSKLQFGAVKNKEGEFVMASLDSVTKAADGALKDIPDDLRYSLTDAPGKEAYPICGTTWAVLYGKQPANKAKALADFLRWATHEGQESTKDLQYARLPESMVKRVDDKINQIKAP